MKPIAVVVLFALSATSSLIACGGWSEEAPPTLDVYLDRLPAKSLGQIFVENTPPSTPEPPPSITDSIKGIAERGKTESAEKLVAEVDHLLDLFRAAGGDHEDLARLHDLRDGLISGPRDCAEYMQWRLDHTDSIKPTITRNPYEYPPKAPLAPPSSLTDEIEKNVETAVEPLRAHWLYIRGAVSYNYGNKADAQKWFDRVVQEYPTHPRAEIALFMSGRCLLSLSREQGSYYGQSPEEIQQTQSLAKAKHTESIAKFRHYLEKYPKGRFIADAYGWLGALEEGVTALDDYIRQVETPGHPEVLKSGLFMIQKCLDDLPADAPSTDEAIALVAKHPRVAMGTLYLVLGSHFGYFKAQPDLNEPIGARSKKWRSVILPKLAAAVASQKGMYVPAEEWQPRYLAILAHAASSRGDHTNALKLTQMTPDALQKNDDLLFARAIALQRGGKAADAIAAFRDFLARFPNSPLTDGARIRFAIALQDNHQAGEAVLELKKLPVGDEGRDGDSVYPPPDSDLQLTDSPIYPDISNAESSQITQVIDAILNFAPLPELESALGNKEMSPTFADELRAIIAERALGHEDFATARRMMSSEQFGLLAKNLETLTGEVAKARSPKQKAEAQLKLGDAWAAERGKLLKLPLDSNQSIRKLFRDEPERAGVNRRTNGRAMGFRNIETELDERDELHHASRWWLRAARSAAGTPVSAAARLKALEAIPKIAGSSDYAFGRALEDEMEKASREIYDKLKAEAPNSVEAKQAAYSTFVRPAGAVYPDKFGYSGAYFSDRWYETRMRRLSGYFWSDYELQGDRTSAYNNNEGDLSGWKNAKVGERINALRDTEKPLPELTQEIKDLHQVVSSHYNSINQAACLNFLDDLLLFLGEPGVTPEIAKCYINLRLDVLTGSSWDPAPVVPPLVITEQGYKFDDPDRLIRKRIAAAIQDAKMQPVVDYLEFLDLAMAANSRVEVTSDNKPPGKDVGDTFMGRDYPAIEKLARTFLEKYPQSRKREAARLVLARAVYRQSWPRIETFTSESGDTYTLPDTWEPFNPKRVFAELDAYDKAFPNGRYAPEIRDMRASVCWRAGDWKPAVDLTVQQLDKGSPDLKRDAVLRLANIFAELATAEHRTALIAAIRENPSALSWLKLYLAKAPNYRDHPLRFLGGYLQDQLGFKLPSPENQKTQ
jgi:TolA-binding protein